MTYEDARENLNHAVQEYLRTAAESREAGTNPDPPPEVVLMAYAGEALWYWVRPGDKSSEDRFRRRLHGQLDDLMAIARDRFGPERVEIWGRWQSIRSDNPESVVLRDIHTGAERTHRVGDPYPE